MKSRSDNLRRIDTAPSASSTTAHRADHGETTGDPVGEPDTVTGADHPEQLTLLTVAVDTRAHQLPTTATPPRSVHARFRLSQRTRELGLRHVAEIREQLEAAKESRQSETSRRLPSRRPAA